MQTKTSRGVNTFVAEIPTPEIVRAVHRLLPHLSSSEPPTSTQVAEIIDCPSTHLLLARLDDAGPIVGTLTLVTFRLPSGVRAWIEDVITDPEARGRGVGEALNLFALVIARLHGARNVDLTSRPSREAANRLYQRIGFKARETNVYRFDLN
jgi:ribosomal protein S18 acetylase RimI-like enzyme